MELGITYWYLERYEDALAVYAQCEPVFLKSGAKLILAHLYNNRGFAFRDLDRIEEARNSFLVSIEMMREVGFVASVANAMESLGGLYQRVGDLDEAVNTWQQALKELAKLQEVPFYFQDLITRRITETLEVQGSCGATSHAPPLSDSRVLCQCPRGLRSASPGWLAATGCLRCAGWRTALFPTQSEPGLRSPERSTGRGHSCLCLRSRSASLAKLLNQKKGARRIEWSRRF